ncbi:putative Rmd1/YagE family protein [Bradyrhizobium liaoningense]
MNADQLAVGAVPLSPKQEAAPTLRIRALMLGDRINASGLEIGTLVSSSAPAAFRVHAGLAVIFRYGVVVLIGLLPSEEKVPIDNLKSRVTGELSPYEEEIAHAQLCHDEAAEAIQPGGPICLAKFSDDRLLVVADALAKSTSLARDERRVAAVST